MMRFHASSLAMVQASPRMGSQIVMKLQGIVPVRPLNSVTSLSQWRPSLWTNREVLLCT
jgi:hypothetical protein